MELEGTLDPAALLEGGLAVFAGTVRPAADVVNGWRYLLDADAAGTTHLAVNFDVIDSDERVAAELRNGVLVVHAGGEPRKVDATVRLTGAQLNGLSAPDATVADLDGVEVTGDAGAPDRLLGLLDRAPTPFWMHLR